ncbi:ASF1A, partial [Symbiodinium microadriaticum]
IEWKVTYVGSANDATKDQVLEEVLVGPVTVGVNRFILQSSPPDHTAISVPDLIGVTVLLITCSYLDEEFVRIGYYVNNEYHHPDHNPEGPLPNQVDVEQLFRNILADRPIVTRINIDWSGNGAIEMPPEGMGEANDDDYEGMAELNGDYEDLQDGQEHVTEDDTIDVDSMQMESNRSRN